MHSNQKMLELMDILKANKTIRFNQEFCDAIGLLKQNLTRIKKGEAHFTPDHIRAACKEYGVNANWIFGLEERVFRNIE